METACLTRTGKDRHTQIYQACERCGKQRWVKVGNGEPIYRICFECAKKSKTYYSGPSHPKWKGGRGKTVSGYIFRTLTPDDPFYPMASSHNHVAEHRLIVAQHIGRCLLEGEVVHHINHVRDDNRIENLQLMLAIKHQRQHIVEHNKNRPLKTQCPQGHPYDEVNTNTYITKDGGVLHTCRLCRKAYNAVYRARMKPKSPDEPTGCELHEPQECPACAKDLR